MFYSQKLILLYFFGNDYSSQSDNYSFWHSIRISCSFQLHYWIWVVSLHSFFIDKTKSTFFALKAQLVSTMLLQHMFHNKTQLLNWSSVCCVHHSGLFFADHPRVVFYIILAHKYFILLLLYFHPLPFSL